MSIPQTRVRTSHALTIRANGQTIGLINSWSPTQSRTMTPIFELGVDNSGNPDEYMPGNITSLSLNINRYDTYPKIMEDIFGSRSLIMLTRQAEPFDVTEVWSIPEKGSFANNAVLDPNININFNKQERFMYRGCWFTSLGKTLSSTDTRIVNANATLVYTQKIKIQGPLTSVFDKLNRISF